MSNVLAVMPLFSARCLIRDVDTDRNMRRIRRHCVIGLSGFGRTIYL